MPKKPLIKRAPIIRGLKNNVLFKKKKEKKKKVKKRKRLEEVRETGISDEW